MRLASAANQTIRRFIAWGDLNPAHESDQPTSATRDEESYLNDGQVSLEKAKVTREIERESTQPNSVESLYNIDKPVVRNPVVCSDRPAVNVSESSCSPGVQTHLV